MRHIITTVPIITKVTLRVGVVVADIADVVIEVDDTWDI